MTAPAQTPNTEAARAHYLSAARRVAALKEVEALAGARICIVGFSGQVGSALVRVVTEANRTALAASPAQVTGIARHEPRNPPAGIDTVYVDVALGADSLALGKCTHVFYAAGVTSDYRSRPQDVIASQLVGLEAVLERVDPACKVVFVSSARVYGRQPRDEVLTEETPAIITSMHLDNVYDSAKRLAESLCLLHHEGAGVRTTIVRAGNVYGLDSPHSSTAAAGIVREAAATGRITITGNASSVRNYCSAVDLAQGLVLAAVRGRSGTAYNIGSDEHLTTSEFAQTVAACFTAPVQIEAASTEEPPSYQRLSIERANAELGYRPALRARDIMPAVVAEIIATGCPASSQAPPAAEGSAR